MYMYVCGIYAHALKRAHICTHPHTRMRRPQPASHSASGQADTAQWASVLPRRWKSGTFVAHCLGASVDLSHWKDVVDLYHPCMTMGEVTVRVLAEHACTPSAVGAWVVLGARAAALPILLCNGCALGCVAHHRPVVRTGPGSDFNLVSC